MTGKKIIAVDIDDVIADSTDSIRRLVNNQFGVHLSEDDYKVRGQYSGYYTRVWEKSGIGDRVDFGKIYDDMTTDQSHVPLIAGAKAAIHTLARMYHVVIVTSRDENWEKATRRWFKDNFGFDDVRVHFTGNYHSGIKQSKGKLCRSLGATLLIDDNPDHCQSALDEGIRAILFGDYGWHETIPEGVIQCKDWAAVLEYIDG